MPGFNTQELYPDIGDLTPQELAERNTYGYIPSRGETAPSASPAPAAPTPAARPYAASPAVDYSPQLDEIITGLAALSRQTQTLTSEVRHIQKTLRGEDCAKRIPETQAEAEASTPYTAPQPSEATAKARAERDAEVYMSTLDAALRLGCSVSRVRRIPGLEYVKRGQRTLYTRDSVATVAAQRKAKEQEKANRRRGALHGG